MPMSSTVNGSSTAYDPEASVLDTGLVIGHIIGATVLAGFGILGLILTWKRLGALPTGVSFGSQHVPERNLSLMKRFSIAIMISTGVGWWVEALGACIDSRIVSTNHCLLFQFGHESLYTMYFAVGPVMWLEAAGRLPGDSWRVMLGWSSVLVTAFWESHASLKNNGADSAIHSFLGVISLTCAVATAYSVTHPDNLISYMAVFGSLVLYAMWLFTSAMTFAFGMLPLHMVAPVFCLEASGLALLLMLIHAMMKVPVAQEYDLATKNEGFAPLCNIKDDNDDACTVEEADDSV